MMIDPTESSRLYTTPFRRNGDYKTLARLIARLRPVLVEHLTVTQFRGVTGNTFLDVVPTVLDTIAYEGISMIQLYVISLNLKKLFIGSLSTIFFKLPRRKSLTISLSPVHEIGRAHV
jgi:hypothetical protein